MQDKEEWDWGQLAPRVFQAFFGSGDELSASEKAGIEKAANAKPWVHMVIGNPPGMHQECLFLGHYGFHLNRHAQENEVS